MPTEIRPELSKKNKYWIPKHRYYELKHFVMQYYDWEEKIREIDSLVSATQNGGVQVFDISNPVAKAAELRNRYIDNMKLCRDIVNKTDNVIGRYVFYGILNESSYDEINATFSIPCGKDMYYELYHKFFYLLDQVKR